jgi:putative endonuclease
MKRSWVYILSSKTGTLYIGVTSDIYHRVLQHKTKKIPGFASRYDCERLVHLEEFAHILSAISREKELKGWRRAKKLSLIVANNPQWRDLAASWGKQMLFPGESIDQDRLVKEEVSGKLP